MKMTKVKAYSDYNYLIGYTKDGVVFVENTVEQIVAFIRHYAFISDTTLTTPLDTLVLSTLFGGFIFDCPNQEFLKSKLIPFQMGAVKAPVFVPVDIELEEEDDDENF